MKPFNIERALAGDSVITRDGKPVTQIKHFDGVTYRESVFGVLDGRVGSWYENGKHLNDGSKSPHDIFMAPITKVGWVNVFCHSTGKWQVSGPIYDTEKDAIDMATEDHVTTKIEWEV